jgi:hypothetical protein
MKRHVCAAPGGVIASSVTSRREGRSGSSGMSGGDCPLPQIKCAGLQDDPEMMAALDEMRRETLQLEQLAQEVREPTPDSG